MKLNIYMKEMKFTSHKQYLSCHLFSIKQGKTQQTKAKCTSSCFLLYPQIQATHHKPYKQLLQERFFCIVYVIGATCQGFPQVLRTWEGLFKI